MLVGGAAGILASVAPSLVSLGLLLGALFILGLVAIRRLTRRGDVVKHEPEEPIGDARAPEGFELRAARGLFYIGMLTLGESTFRVSSLGLTISEIAFILSFGLCATAVLRGSAVPPLPTPMMAAVGLFVFGGAVSSLVAQSPAQSAVQVAHGFYVLLLWPWVGVMVIRTRRQLLAAFGLWALSAALDGVGALAQVAGVHLPGTVVELGRYEGFTTHANDLGGVTGVAFVPALVFATRGAQGALRALLRWLPVALLAIGLVLSGSISGMAAAALAVLVWLSSPAVRSSSRVVVAVAALFAIAVLAVAGGRVTSPFQRVTQVTSSATGSARDRISNAQAAWQRIKQNPIVGTGLDTPDTGVVIISQGLSVPYQVHGLPVAAWYESGIFGLMGLLGLIGCLVILSWRAVRRSREPDEQLIAWGLLGALGASIIELMTAPLVFQGYDWIVPVMLVAYYFSAPSAELTPIERGVGAPLRTAPRTVERIASV